MSDHLFKNIEYFYLDIFDRALSDVYAPVCEDLNISADNNKKNATKTHIEEVLYIMRIHSYVMNIKRDGIILVLISINEN